MNIQRKNSTHHFRMQSEREQTLVLFWTFKLLREIGTQTRKIGQKEI